MLTPFSEPLYPTKDLQTLKKFAGKDLWIMLDFLLSGVGEPYSWYVNILDVFEKDGVPRVKFSYVPADMWYPIYLYVGVEIRHRDALVLDAEKLYGSISYPVEVLTFEELVELIEQNREIYGDD